MNRRTILVMLGGSAVASPWVARAQAPWMGNAQPSAIPAIGYLNGLSPAENGSLLDFLHGLSESGYVEGQNLVIEYRWAQHDAEKLPAMARDLVSRHVAGIFTALPQEGGGLLFLPNPFSNAHVTEIVNL